MEESEDCESVDEGRPTKESRVDLVFLEALISRVTL